jgi:hypothetical protein
VQRGSAAPYSREYGLGSSVVLLQFLPQRRPTFSS